MRIVVLIPSYNSAKSIVETIGSVRYQTSIGLISAVYLADDCSKDDTVSLAETTWQLGIPFYAIRNQHNVGERQNVSDAMRLIGEAADWILILHADDVAKSNWIEQMRLVIGHCADKVGTICASWDTLMPNGSIIAGEDDPGRPLEIIDGTVESVRDTIKRGCWWHISGCAVRARAFQDVGDFNPQFPQLGDWDWLLRCLDKSWAVAYIPRTLTMYRQHVASVSSASFSRDADILESLDIIRHYARRFSKRFLLSLHLRRCVFVMRRLGRAITQLSFQRGLRATTTLSLILGNLFQCLRGRLSMNASR